MLFNIWRPGSGAMGREVRLIRPTERRTEVASGDMTRAVGVSGVTAGAEGIYMVVAVLAPGHASIPHRHINCESAIYVVKGKGKFLCGPDLETVLEIAEGDCLYVPPEAVHQPVNDGDGPLELIVARNTQEEIVVEYIPGP